MKGGKRAGAGRKKGSVEKLKLELQSLADRVKGVIENGLTPVEYMLAVMRDENNSMAIRLTAAGQAATFVHKRMPADMNLTATISVPESITMKVIGPRR